MVILRMFRDRQEPLSILRHTFGFSGFRGLQEEVITQVCSGGHALVVMPTGSGKSLCYQIPAIVRPGTGIIVSPLIALMQDQVAALRRSEEHTSELQSRGHLVCRLLLEKKQGHYTTHTRRRQE